MRAKKQLDGKLDDIVDGPLEEHLRHIGAHLGRHIGGHLDRLFSKAPKVILGWCSVVLFSW